MKPHVKTLAGLALFSCLSATALAADTAGCTLENGKTLSLTDLGTAPAYRYGTKDKAELSLAAGQKDIQVYKGLVMFSGGVASYIRFANGQYSYVAYDGMGKGWAFTGLIVYKKDKVIMSKSCKNDKNALDFDVSTVQAPEDPEMDAFEFAPS